jgi:protein gp37
MNKTKIEWCDMTWNPVTGCHHKCAYCYARNIANRFGGCAATQTNNANYIFSADSYEITFKHIKDNGTYAPFPYRFKPTFHKYRLHEPEKIEERKNIFVCSMADLFGSWVPDNWIEQVLKACYLRHWYFFLTKNPQRYIELSETKKLPGDGNFWYGTTITKQDQPYFQSDNHCTFLSIEPLQGLFDRNLDDLKAGWIIIGAETGNHKDKIVPRREWIEAIVEKCRVQNVPVFMKNSLADIWGEPLIQEYPRERPKNAGVEA